MTGDFDHQILDPSQSRLKLRSDLVVAPHDQSTFVVEDPLAGKYFLIGNAEWLFLTQIDGTCTIGEAIGRAATQAPQGAALTEREGIAVARWLVDQSLAKPVDLVLGSQADGKPIASAAAPFNPFTFRVASFNPDAMLTAMDARVGWIWSRWFLALWLGLGIVAVWKLTANWAHWNAVPTRIFDGDTWLRMGIVWCVLKVIHEFGHGLSCRHFGIPVRGAGLLLVFFAPVPFVDVSSSWRLASRFRRMVIAAAGMYLELMIAFAALVLWNPTSHDIFDRLCVDVVVLAGFTTVAFNANPLMRFDGYYILADALKIPNLSSESRQYLSNVTRFWFRGLDVMNVNGGRFKRCLVKSYAFASFFWRCLTFVGIAVSLIASWSWWGAAAAVVVAWFWFGLSLPRRAKPDDASSRTRPGIRRQQAAFAALGLATLILIGWLVRPVSISAPAIVEYAPLTVLRAAAEGFVTKVQVVEGDHVEAGQVLLELTNDDVLSNIKRTQVELEQARLRSRSYLIQNELSKQQTELAKVASLEKQLDEYRGQQENLRLCAPQAATVTSSDVSGLLGRYVEKGEVLLILGSEDKKELLVSASSIYEKKFVAHLGQAVSSYRPFGGMAMVTGRLSTVEPRISESLPHNALGADAGGEVAVKLERKNRDEFDGDRSQSVTPRLEAAVELDRDVSRRLRAGQRLTVSLTGNYETWGGRMLNRWHEYLVEVAGGAATGDPAGNN